MRHVGLGGFDQVGDQIVAALELDVDLREGVLEAIAQVHQVVVERDQPENDRDDDYQKSQKFEH